MNFALCEMSLRLLFKYADNHLILFIYLFIYALTAFFFPQWRPKVAHYISLTTLVSLIGSAPNAVPCEINHPTDPTIYITSFSLTLLT